MENNNSGFQVVFRIRSKKRVIPSKSISDTIGILSGYQVIEEPQYTEDGVGIEVFEIYKEYTGKSDMSFSDFKRLDLKQAYFWNQHKEFKVEISEQDARDSGLFKYRSSFICWVNIEILKDFESVEFNNTSTEPDVFRVVLDYNKLIESWINAGFPESWGK